jgi:hypothetical protein
MAATFVLSQSAAVSNLDQAERQLGTAVRLTGDLASAVATRSVTRAETLFGQVNTYLGLAETSNSRAFTQIQDMGRQSTNELERQNTRSLSARYDSVQQGITSTRREASQLINNLNQIRYDEANNRPRGSADSAGDDVANAQRGNQDDANVSVPPVPLQTFDDDGNLVDIPARYSNESNADEPRLLNDEDLGLQDGTTTTGGARPIVTTNQTQPGPADGGDDQTDTTTVNVGGTASADGRPAIAPEFLSPIAARPNALAKLASMSYTVSIYLMTPREYANMLRSQRKSITTESLIIQSGGIDGTPISGVGRRNPFFKYDYYLDDLTIRSEIGTQSGSRAHNAVQMDFTIIEPNGITLLPTLRDAVRAHLQNNDPTLSYVQCSYLMVIRFYGYDANGNLINGSQLGQAEIGSDRNTIVEKWIPFQINEINYKIASRNVEYRVSASIPQTVIGFSQVYATIPFDFELKAPDVATLLNGKPVIAPVGPTRDRLLTPEEIREIANEDVTSSGTAPPKASSLSNRKTYTQGLCEALNQHQLELQKSGAQETADVYEIILEPVPGLIDAKIARPAKQDKSRTAFTPGQNARDDLLMRTSSYDNQSKNFSVTRGTQIVQLIDLIMRNSSYIVSQQNLIQDEKTGQWRVQTPVKTVQWYKIRCRVEPQDQYDKKRRQYANKIIYYISRYQINDPRIPEFPTAGYRGAHKIYNYWFTGQNSEVIDFEINVNANYVTIFGNNQNRIAQPLVGANGRIFERIVYQNKPNMEGTGGPGDTNSIAANLADRLYQDTDIANSQVVILGDPDWLIQSDVFYTGTFSLTQSMPDGSVNADASEILYELRFNPVADYDIGTGLAKVNANNTAYSRSTGERNLPSESSVFSAHTVWSYFKGGKFTQRLAGNIKNFDLSKSVAPYLQQQATAGSRFSQADVRRVDNEIAARNASQSTDTVPGSPTLLDLEFGGTDALANATGVASETPPKAGSTTISDDAAEPTNIVAP